MDIYTCRIKPLLTSTGLTMKELAPLIGIPVKTIYNWENGVKSYDKYYPQIASYFNVSIEYLKGETDEKNPATTRGDGISSFDKSILNFVHSLPAEQLRAILVAVKAPTSLIDALDREEGKE